MKRHAAKVSQRDWRPALGGFFGGPRAQESFHHGRDRHVDGVDFFLFHTVAEYAKWDFVSSHEIIFICILPARPGTELAHKSPHFLPHTEIKFNAIEIKFLHDYNGYAMATTTSAKKAGAKRTASRKSKRDFTHPKAQKLLLNEFTYLLAKKIARKKREPLRHVGVQHW